MDPHIPPLRGGGLLLTWRCTNACRHCLYRCGPRQPDAWIDDAMLARTFDALAAEPSFHGLHLAGGEAMLRPNLVERAVRMAVARGIALDYLETNGGWCASPEQARAGFARLHDAGLPAVLISASLFHAEFIPPARTRIAVEAARSVFGPGGVLVWTSDVYGLLAHLPQDRCVPLAESRARLGLDAAAVLRLHPYVHPPGRVGACLMRHARRRPAQAWAETRCADVLAATGHVHLAPSGELFTGHCPGVAPATVDDLHPRIAEDSAFSILWREGPCGLLARAPDFTPDAKGYVSACDLCWAVRRHLRGRMADLRPAEAYAN